MEARAEANPHSWRPVSRCRRSQISLMRVRSHLCPVARAPKLSQQASSWIPSLDKLQNSWQGGGALLANEPDFRRADSR